MSYPQPNPNIAVNGGQGFFRLNTPLSSPGDIYDSAQGSMGFAVGPESDIARINIAYYDILKSPQFLNQVQISPDRAFVGPLYPYKDKYQPSNIEGRILIWSNDLYDPNYIPTFANIAGGDTVTMITPVLDVIEYFSQQPSLAPQRPDKQFYFQQPPSVAGALAGSGWLVIPYYGRSYATIESQNFTGATVGVSLYGVNFAITDDASSPIHQEFAIDTSGSMINGATYTKVVSAASTGMFDVLVLGIHIGGGPTSHHVPVNIRMSDRPQ